MSTFGGSTPSLLYYVCIYEQVLDHNIEFCQTKGFLVFLLKLLSYSATPTSEEFQLDQDDKSSSSGPSYGLGALPTHLQAPWLRIFFIILYKVSGTVTEAKSIQWNLR